MERLRKVIEQYGRWSALTTYADRIEAHLSSDFSHAVENAKALLETIGKEICKTKSVELGAKPKTNAVMKKAFTAVGYPGENRVTQISTALATIGQQMGNLRNEIGITAHGKGLDELKARNDSVDALTREFLVDTTVIVAAFLIRAFENENPRITPLPEEEQPLYIANDSFNDFWDDLYGEFEMGDYSFPASEILFNVDIKAYQTELAAFKEDE
ncbi:MAG: abortive infection family protein [Desulfobacula sp.]|nr:abortive infection family protein [Desulfobacula sp.]